MTRLGLDATALATPAATTTPVIPMIRVPIRRHVGFIGPVNSHRTSQPPPCDTKCDTKRAIHDNK